MTKIRSNITPYNYQLEDMRFLVQLKKGSLLHDPGVGKTFGVLLAITYILERDPQARALVIMPPILLNTWKDKLHDYFNTDIAEVIYSGSIAKRAGIKLDKYRIVFISYDLLQRDFDRLKKLPWSIVVADETKYIKIGEVKKSKKTKRMNKFGCVQSMAHKAEYCFLMNGTPVTKSPADIFPFIQLCNPNIYVTKKNFIRQHAVFRSDESGYPKIVSWKKLDKLKDILQMYSRRLIKSEVLELPSKQLIVRQFSLDKDHEARLRELMEFGFVEVLALSDPKTIFLDGMALAMTARQATIDPKLLGLQKQSAYITDLQDLLEDLGDEKIILYAHFKNTMSILRDLLTSRQMGYMELHGGITAQNKDKAVSGFKAGEFQVLLANPKSAGVGLDFQMHCSNVIYFELDHEVDSFWQGMDRVHRPGQTKPVNIFVFIARNTPAVSLLRGVKTNINYVQQVLDGKQEASILWNNRITESEIAAWKKI